LILLPLSLYVSTSSFQNFVQNISIWSSNAGPTQIDSATHTGSPNKKSPISLPLLSRTPQISSVFAAARDRGSRRSSKSHAAGAARVTTTAPAGAATKMAAAGGALRRRAPNAVLRSATPWLSRDAPRRTSPQRAMASARASTASLPRRERPTRSPSRRLPSPVPPA
jgi:hypothetical protein